MKTQAYTTIELLGVVALISIIGAISLAGYSHFAGTVKKSAAERNTSLLNAAVAAYDQQGGLMSLEVLADSPDAASQVFCRLASAKSFSQVRGGAVVAPWQRPVISTHPTDWRAVWVSDISSATSAAIKKIHKGLGGLRNPLLEEAIQSGQLQGGRFVLVGPDAYQGLPKDVPGIVAFAKDGQPCESILNFTPDPTSTPTPTPTPTATPRPTVSPTPTTTPTPTPTASPTATPTGGVVYIYSSSLSLPVFVGSGESAYAMANRAQVRDSLNIRPASSDSQVDLTLSEMNARAVRSEKVAESLRQFANLSKPDLRKVAQNEYVGKLGIADLKQFDADRDGKVTGKDRTVINRQVGEIYDRLLKGDPKYDGLSAEEYYAYIDDPAQIGWDNANRIVAEARKNRKAAEREMMRFLKKSGQELKLLSSRFIEYRHTNSSNWAQSLSWAVYEDTYEWEFDVKADSIVRLDPATGTILGTVPATSEKLALMESGQPLHEGDIVLGWGVLQAEKEARRIKEIRETGKWPSLSPVIVDLAGTGAPDLLAPVVWWRHLEREPVKSAMRKFDMGTGLQHWEWIGPDSGLLVHNPTGDPCLPVNGRDLFGNFSFGKGWPDGFSALASLESNGNDVLEGEELDSVWVWQDKNSDARVQRGELRRASEHGITLIAHGVDRRDPARLRGHAVIGGEWRECWDWWPMGSAGE